MKVNSVVTLNMERLQQINQAAIKALEKTGENLHGQIIQAGVVPRMDGALEGEKFHVDIGESGKGRVILVHEGPYARRLYYHPEYNFHREPWEESITHKDGFASHLKHDGNPNAKGKWFEDWQQGGREQNYVEETFRRFYRMEAGT